VKILALDPGCKFGWATNQTGRLEWGTENFGIKNGESSGNRWRRFGEWLKAVTVNWAKDPVSGGYSPWPIDLLVYERSVFAPKARAAAEIAAGFTTRLEEHCERHGIALQPVGVSELKSFALGPAPRRKKGDQKFDRSKDAMIRRAKYMLNGNVVGPDTLSRQTKLSCEEDWIFTDDEADALLLYFWALSNCARVNA
jgi:hypothetical protein